AGRVHGGSQRGPLARAPRDPDRVVLPRRAFLESHLKQAGTVAAGPPAAGDSAIVPAMRSTPFLAPVVALVVAACGAPAKSSPSASPAAPPSEPGSPAP